jgi:hypothetical protein
MIKQLTKLATHLDAKGLSKEADYLDAIIKKIAQDERAKDTGYVVTEIVDIGNGYSQIKFNSPQGAIDEQYIFKTEELNLTPGENVSDETISDLTMPIEDDHGDVIEGSVLMGEGSYQDPGEFFRDKGIAAPLKKSEQQVIPAGALLIMSASSGDKTTCYYRLGSEYYTKEGGLSYDCTGGGTIENMSLQESQR